MNRQQNIIWLCEVLDMTTAMLAGALGVTERTLLADKDSSKRDGRLNRLLQVVHELRSEVPKCSNELLRTILYNSYIKLNNSDDDEENGMSLMGYVNWSAEEEFCSTYVHAALWDYYKWIEEDWIKQPWYKRWLK
jgi:hypothetical protein